MKKDKLLKLVMVLIMGVVLLASTVEVFALSDPDDGLNFFEDQSDQLDLNTTEPEPEPEIELELETETKPETNSNDNKNTANNYNTNLPKAGVAENTLAGVVITILAITAIFAYKKVNEYKNI